MPSLLISVEEYLNTSYADGDGEYLDGQVVHRNIGSLLHSALQKILIVHLALFEKRFGLAVRPECRTRVNETRYPETRYRVPDLLVMTRPFRQSDRIVLDPPLLIVEILSPDDRMHETIQRFREYEKLGVGYIVLMDPEDRSTFTFVNGDLIQGDLMSFELPNGESVPFDSAALLEKLNHE